MIYTADLAEKLLKGLPIAKAKLAKKAEDALKFSNKFPIVLKIVSEKALHKTEINGISIVKGKEELAEEYARLQKLNAKFKGKGILVQEFVKGKEIIIGVKDDETFGKVIMLGIGGVFVELLKDVVFRICPITEEDAQEMIEELKGKKILFGFRGEKGVNLKILKKVLVRVSELALKQKIKELDINPFILNEREGKVVDFRAVVD